MEEITVYVDGLEEPKNPGGVATGGYIIHIPRSDPIRWCGVLGEGEEFSNNCAEYFAVDSALKWLIDNNLNHRKVVINSDSRLVVNQLSGNWSVRGGLYAPYYRSVEAKLNFFDHIAFKWIPREENTEADALSRQAYEGYCRDKGREPVYGSHTRFTGAEKMTNKQLHYISILAGKYGSEIFDVLAPNKDIGDLTIPEASILIEKLKKLSGSKRFES